MARIMQDEYLTNDEQKTEGYMVAVDADTYEEARAIAYRMEMESAVDMMALMGMMGG